MSLVAIFQAEADAVGEEVRVVEKRSGPQRGRAAVHLRDVDGPVDLVAGTNNLVPVKEVIAERGAFLSDVSIVRQHLLNAFANTLERIGRQFPACKGFDNA